MSVITERFRMVCRDRGRSAAVQLLETGDVLTFDDLLDRYCTITRVLSDARIGRGAVVVSALANDPIFFPLLVACMDAGNVLIPLGEATTAEATALLDRSGAAAVVTHRPLPARSGREYPLDRSVRLIATARPAQAGRYGEAVVLKLTSGSTDLPKAALASEHNIVNDGRHVIDAMGIGPRDVNYTCIPLSHSYALGNVVMPLIWQGTGVALRQSFNPARFCREADASGASVFPGVPFMFERLQSLDAPLPPSLRLLITAGARIDPQIVARIKDRFDLKLHSFYGSSETGGISYDDADEVADPLDVGRPMPETTVAIRTTDGHEPGRIFVCGNAVAAGYADVDRADPTGFCDDGFLTADNGYLRADGRLVLVGRQSALVNVAGRKVDPDEVERTLAQLPGIAAARVLGVACERRGQQVVAFVVRSDPALTTLTIRKWCATTLSPYKIPRRVLFLDQLPVDARGKIDRRTLLQLASADAGPS